MLSGKQTFYYDDDEFGRNELTVFSQAPGEIDLDSLVNIWNYIEEEQFDAIINLGDVLFATDYFKGKIPILCISTSTHLPLSNADQYLLIKNSIDPEEKALIHKLGIKDPAVSWSLNVSPGKKESTVCRETLGIPANAFVYAIVGNRLGQEINDGFVTVCKKLLEANDKNHLCFIGSYNELPPVLKKLGLNEPGRISHIPFQDDLRSFYTVCDVYLNPFRSGGGVSAQIAILEGLPVVTLLEGDVSVCILPEQCCKTISDYEKLALSLSTDASIYERWRQWMGELSQSLQSNKPSIQRLYNLLLSIRQEQEEAWQIQNASDEVLQNPDSSVVAM
jgi:glycosyltransferase involved in cell wall biosynthesis